jgi:two-component system chemotaxis sensor kinase CheA
MDDLLSEFLTETNESLATLDNELVRLEQNPNDPGLLGNIFRIVHTIKGTCGFLALSRLEAVAHASENVLGRVRDGQLVVTPESITLILASLDRIKMVLAHLEATEAEPEGNDSDLIAELNAVAEGKSVPPPAPKPAPAPTPVVTAAPSPAPEPVPRPIDPSVAVVAKTEVTQERGAETLPAVQEAPPAPVKAPPEAAAEVKESALAASNIRVNVDLLENLMTMVSELVLTRNQLMQILRSQKDSEFAVSLQRLSHVTSELQEGVMKTRMQPIGSAWAKLPRLVRDLSHELGKKIDLQMKGADTELDRQVLELIKDPLTHMVRNSGDHGIELPAERVKAGKSDTGTIMLNAYHEGGHIVIEIGDDGRGLAVDKIKAKAIQNGLASEAEIAQMSEQQIYQFIFRAGFSTAAAVTSVSGRGVGMDVVRTNIEKIGGAIELRSALGRGSTFIIKIPLTLAIVSALIVECAGERFAIPQISVVELVRPSTGSDSQIEHLNGAPVLRLRDRLLPLVPLERLLRLGRSGGAAADEIIVVAQVGTYSFGIIVDRIFDTEEIVVKPVAPLLRDIAMFSGNTILGDGSVIMILDPNGIAAATGAATGGQGQITEKTVVRSARQDDRTSLLLFRAGSGGPKAVPLALVARLEEIDRKDIEYSNGKPVVQYRGKLMPLVPIEEGASIASEGAQALLVFSDQQRSMGILVDEIVDIVEEVLKVELGTERPGLIGSAIIAGKATDLVDTGHYLMQAYDDWFGIQDQVGFGETEPRATRILLVDDSPFFRNLLTPLLSVAGYDVTAMDSADRALDLLDRGDEFDAIISDIEMPGMNGFEFAEAVRSKARLASIPLIALSSHASPQDLERGRLVGFDDYIAKFDRDSLLATLSSTLLSHRSAAA